MSTGSTPRGLIDTPVLTAYREGWPAAVQFITDVRRGGRPELSELSALALIAGCQDAADLAGLGWFFYAAHVHSITAHISRRARQILERLPPPAPLTAGDALVAATALAHTLPLYTLDPGRFAAVPGLSAVQPY